MKLQATTHEAVWAPVIDAWLADAVDGGPAAEAALAEAAGACLAAAEKAPCARCDGRFAEQWGDAPWHCFDCKERIDPSRAAPEGAAGETSDPYWQHAAAGELHWFSAARLVAISPEIAQASCTGWASH